MAHDLAKDIENLSHSDGFVRLCAHIYGERERIIKDLRGADDGTIREISGKIQAHDDLLTLMGWDNLRSRAANLP